MAIGIGFDPARQLVVLELHERPLADDEDDDDDDDDDEDDEFDDPTLAVAEGEALGGDPEDGYLARLYCLRRPGPGHGRTGARPPWRVAGRRARCAAGRSTRRVTSAPG